MPVRVAVITPEPPCTLPIQTHTQDLMRLSGAYKTTEVLNSLGLNRASSVCILRGLLLSFFFLNLGIKRLSEKSDWNSLQKTHLLLPVKMWHFTLKFRLG